MPFEDALAELDALITERSSVPSPAVPSTLAPPALTQLDQLLGLPPRELKRAQLQHQFNEVGTEDTSETMGEALKLVLIAGRAGLMRAGAGITRTLGRSMLPFGMSDRAADVLAERGTQEGQGVAEAMEQVGGGPLTKATLFLGSTAVQSLPPLLAGPAGLPAMAMAAGAQTFGGVEQEAYERYREQGDSETKAFLKSLPPAVASGTVTSLLTRFMGGGTERAVQKILGSFGQNNARQTVSAALREAVADIPKEALLEFPEEALDQLAQGIISKFSYAPERTTPEILRESLLAGLAGLALGGGIATARVPVAAAGPAIEGMDRAERLENLQAVRSSPERRDYLERLGLTESSMAAGTEQARYDETRNQQANLPQQREGIFQGQNLPQDSGEVRSGPRSEAGRSRELLPAAPVEEQAPPVGFVRFYHGGVPGEGARDVTQQYEYAAGYAAKSPGGVVRYVDVPETSPLLSKAFDDTGLPYRAPYNAFTAPAELMATAKVVGQEAAQASQPRPVSRAEPPVSAPPPVGTTTVAQPPPESTFAPVAPSARGRGVPVGQIRARLAVPPGQRGRRAPQAPPGSAFTGTPPPSQRGRQKLYMEGEAESIPILGQPLTERPVWLNNFDTTDLSTTLASTATWLTSRAKAPPELVKGLSYLSNRFAGKVRAKIVLSERTDMTDPGAPAAYDPATETITVFLPMISDSSEFANSILHETTHALTSSTLTRWMIQTGNVSGLSPEIISAFAETLPLTEREIRAAEGLAGDFQDFLDALKANNWDRADYYGASNLHEFAAEIVSNPDFQDMTAAMKGSTTNKSLWQEIVEAFKKFLAAMFGTSEGEIEDSLFISALNNVLTIAENYKPGSDIAVTRLADQFPDTTEVGEILPTVQSSLGTLREALNTGDPQLVAEAKELVRREEAGEVLGQQERIRQSAQQLLDIYNQRNRAGDVRLTGEALQRMKVIEGLVNDRWVRKHMINPTLDLQDAATEMEEAFHTFTGLQRDPQSTDELRSAAALVATKRLDGFLASIQAMEANYEQRRARMLHNLDQLNETRAEVDAAREAMDNLLEDFRQIGREIVAIEGNSAAATAYRRTLPPVALRRALTFVTRNVDLRGVDNGTITRLDQLRDHILNTAAAMVTATDDQTVDQIIGANRDVVEGVARYILRSQPLRNRIVESRAWITVAAQRVPLDKFKTALAKEIKAGHTAAALRLFVDGVGATAVERARTGEAARFFKRKEQKALIDLQVLDEKMELARGLAAAPGLRTTSEQVHDQMGVRRVIVEPEGMSYVLPGLGTNEDGSPKPDVTIAMSMAGLANERNIKAGQDWIKDAHVYMADTESPDYDPRRAAGLQATINMLLPLVDISINPAAPRFMEGAPRKAYRKLFDFFGQVEAVPEFILDHVAGTVGERANQSLTAVDTVMEQASALSRQWGHRLEDALRKAIVAQKDADGGELTLDKYRELVYGPIAASHQEYENLGRLKAGDSLHNGYTVKPEDMAYFNLERAFEDATIKMVTSTGETQMEAIKNQPSGIFYKGADGKRYVRLPGHTGPGTVTRRFSSLATRPGGWIESWRTGTVSDRIDVLNQSVNRLILGYLRGAGENTLNYNYRWRDAVRSIYKETSTEPVESFEDLIDRLQEFHLEDENGELLGRNEIQSVVLGEFNDLFKKWETFINSRNQSNTSVLQIYGGRSMFHVERGEQVVPSLWYDYGTVGAGDRMSYLRDAAVFFVVEHVNAVEQLQQSLETLHARLDEGGGPRQKTTRGEQLAGKEYYNWNQLNHLRHRVTGYVNSLNMMITRLNAVHEKGGSQVMDITGANPVTDLVAGSLLFAVAPQILNATGGMWITSAVHRMVTNQSIWASMARVARVAAKVTAKAFTNMLATDKTEYGKAVREFLEDHQGAGITGKMAETLVEWIDSSRELWRHSAQLGMNQNADLWRTIASQFGWFDRGGVSSQRQPETALGRTGGRVRTIGRALGTFLTGGSVGAVDSWVNAISVELSRELEQDIANRAAEYGKLRERRAAAGGWNPGDMTDMRNRFSPEELRGGWNDQSKEAAATRLRQLFLRRVGVNLDEAMYAFYRRLVDSGVDVGDPGFQIPEGMNLLTDAQLNQLTLALSEATNQASFSTRPISPRANKFIQLLSLFHGYPAMAIYRLTSSVDQLANRKWSGQSLGRLAMWAGAALSAAVVGALAIGGQDWARRKFNRISPYPTVFDTEQEGWEYAKTVMGGAAALIPFYGGLLNAAIGRAYRTGFDINSSFVVLNLATDAIKTLKKVVQTGGNPAELARPFVEFGTRWAFPLTLVGPRLPNVSGLYEQRNVANLLARGARGTGLEERIRRSSSGSDVVYTPMSAKLDSFWNAIGNQDPPTAAAVWQEMVRMRSAENDPNPEASVARAVQSRHPLNRVFGEPLTRDEYGSVLSHLNPEDAERVQKFLAYSDSVTTSLGGTPLRFGGEAGGTSAPRVAAASVGRRAAVPRLTGLRRAAIGGVRIPSGSAGVSVRASTVRAPAPSRVRNRRLRAPRIPRPRAIAGRMRVRSRVGGLRRARVPRPRQFY